jgi:hypothetical protein
MPFCTRCGHNNSADSVFCENCGASLKKSTRQPQSFAATSQPSSSVRTTPRRDSNPKKLIVAGTVALCVIGIVGAGAAWFLGSETASEAAFARAAQKFVDENKVFAEEKNCLTNFAYDRDPVAVNQPDSRTLAWMNVLVEGGLYEKPEVRNSGSPFRPAQLIYRKTDAGRKATQTRKLCFADGLVVKKIEDLRKPEKRGSVFVSQAVVILGYKNPMPWTRNTQAKAIMPDRFTSDPRETMQFALGKDDKWAVLSRTESAGIERERRNVQQRESVERNASGGFFDKIASLFSGFGGNPLIGKWQGETLLGMITPAVEFTPDSMRNEMGVTKVRYEVKDREVLIFPEGQGSGMIVKLVDNETIGIDMGLGNVKFKRIK